MPRGSAELVMGTAQIGLSYGVANRTGFLKEEDAVALLGTASRSGLRTFDTARAYGASEERIGLAFAGLAEPPCVVTKLDPLADLTVDALPTRVAAAAEASLVASSTALRRERLDVVLLHRAAHRIAWGGTVWDLMRGKVASGAIGSIGVSVQSVAEAHAALGDPDVRHIQMPFNLLDHRWHELGVVEALRLRPDVTVHARSALLQGLLTLRDDVPWPSSPPGLRQEIERTVRGLALRFGCDDPVHLALAYVRGQDWIDGVVLGFETRGQLEANLALWRRPPLDPEAIEMVRGSLPRCPETLLDPSQWSLEHVSPALPE